MVDLIQGPGDAAQEQERPGESDAAAKARAGASAVASRDDDAGKVLSTAEIVAESEPSVALIKGKASSGTGFLVAPGLVATNAHVIGDELITDLDVQFVSADERYNTPLKAELLYEDTGRDLAFLAVKTDLKPLRIARTYAFRKGEDITVIGNPGFGDGQVLENAISRGVMSTKVQIDGRGFYQLGIAINPGNSGGPVFDSSGRVIGVATLKASKQEATGFSIPIEDLQNALTELARDTPGDADQYRSRHRVLATVKRLGGGGAFLCLMIDLRRASAMTGKSDLKDLLDKFEPIAAEFNDEVYPSLIKTSSRIKDDHLIAPPVKRMVGDMAENLKRIRTASASGWNVDATQIRPLKQTHKRLIIDLMASLKFEVPKELMIAFEDPASGQPSTFAMNPQGLGSFGPRLQPRLPGGAFPPGGIGRSPGNLGRPPSVRDRMRGRIGIR